MSSTYTNVSGFADAVFPVFLHDERSLPRIRTVVLVLHLLLFDRLFADDISYGVSLADGRPGRAPVRLRLPSGSR